MAIATILAEFPFHYDNFACGTFCLWKILGVEWFACGKFGRVEFFGCGNVWLWTTLEPIPGTVVNTIVDLLWKICPQNSQ